MYNQISIVRQRYYWKYVGRIASTYDTWAAWYTGHLTKRRSLFRRYGTFSKATPSSPARTGSSIHTGTDLSSPSDEPSRAAAASFCRLGPTKPHFLLLHKANFLSGPSSLYCGGMASCRRASIVCQVSALGMACLLVCGSWVLASPTGVTSSCARRTALCRGRVS